MRNIIFTIANFIFLFATGYALPASAQGLLSGDSFRSIVQNIASFITGTLIPITIGLGVVYFLWNMVHYVLNMSNEKEREQFKKYMVNSVIGIFIMLSVWGIIAIMTGVIFGDKAYIPQLPTGDGNQNQAQ